MPGSHQFLEALAVVLCVAAVTTVVCQKLRQPVVLGYMLAGLIIGPHVPVPLVADPHIVHTLSELGVILLMFALGLEFSLRKLLRVGATAGVTAVVQCTAMVWLGFVTGRAFGWTTLESLYAGALVAISSTTIIAKAFEEQGITGGLKELVVGILIVEDLIAILLMAGLTTASSGTGLTVGVIVLALGKLLLFLAGVLVGGMLLVPRLIRLVVGLGRPETTVVASIGVCFAGALLAQQMGYSVALGAFLAGALVAESGEELQVERLILPLKDVLAAVFFVSVGMMIDPGLIRQHWVATLVFTLVVILGKILSVTAGAFLTGNGVRTSVQAGMSLAQIGEFSFIIAGLGLSLKATGPFLYPLAVAVSAMTTLTTPWLIRAAGPAAELLDRKLPRPLQTFAALYGTWLDAIRRAPPTPRLGVRRLMRLILLDAGMLAVISIGASLGMPVLLRALEQRLGVTPDMGRWLVLGGAVLLSVPFLFGLMRLAARLGRVLAERALPLPAVEGPPVMDVAIAPRRVLATTLQLGMVLLVGIPLLALTQPFVHGKSGLGALGALVALVLVAFWRSALNLHAHVRAGSQVVLEALARQTQAAAPPAPADALSVLVPGLGAPTPVRVEPGSPAAGHTLADLNLRGVTGATVLAIRRGAHGIIPTAQESLEEGDVLALAGTERAVRAAMALLRPRPRPV